MGKIALQVTLDILAGKSEGGFVETPTTIVDQNSVLQILKDADSLYPRPSKVYWGNLSHLMSVANATDIFYLNELKQTEISNIIGLQ